MNSDRTKNEGKISILAPIGVFAFFFAVFYFIYWAASGATVYDDVFYHLSAALSYAHHYAVDYPIYTTFSTKVADIHYGFHLLLAFFIKNLNPLDFEAVLGRAKLVQSLLVGLYFSVIYGAAYLFLKNESGVTKKKAAFWGIASVLMLFAIAPIFSFRMLLIRPHIISSLFLLISFITLARGKIWPTFVLSFLMPFAYSLSLLILIPPGLYFISKFMHEGVRNVKLSHLGPLGVALLGICLGILARPDGLNYLYNGTYLVLLAVINPYTALTLEAAEVGRVQLLAKDLPWLLPFAAALLYSLVRRLSAGSARRAWSFPKVFLLVSALFYGALFLAVQRASEYFFPYLAIFLIVYGYEALSVSPETWLPAAPDRGNILHPVFMFTRKLIGSMRENGREWKKIGIVSVIVLFLASWLGLVSWAIKQNPDDKYAAAAEFIEKDSGGKGIVFTQYFHMYPALVFYNHENKYIMGMDSIFTYEYNPSLYFLWLHLIYGEKLCPERTCPNSVQGRGIYETIAGDFKASYVFIDESQKNGTVTVDNTPALLIGILSDSRFKKVFTDPKYPEISVYKI